MSLHWFKKNTLMFAVALSLASATVSMGFPSEWGDKSAVRTIGVDWVVPSALYDLFPGHTIALVFVGPIYHEVSLIGADTGNPTLSWDPAGVLQQPTSTQGKNSDPFWTYQQKPVLMDLAQLTHDPNTGFGANDKRSSASINFCEYPENGSQTSLWIYGDLKPSGANAGLWNYYPTASDINTFTLVQAPGTGGFIMEGISLWFTVFIFDDTAPDGYLAYDMEYKLNMNIQGNGLASGSVTLTFRDEDYKDLDQVITYGVPEPATALLALAGIGLLLSQKRKRK